MWQDKNQTTNSLIFSKEKIVLILLKKLIRPVDLLNPACALQWSGFKTTFKVAIKQLISLI
jgi:hypothetical protein